jgi:LEA14-like dessication related protein
MTLVSWFVLVAWLSGCHVAKPPELRVVGARREVVFVQVTNPESRPMRLDRLEYTFAADGTTIASGEVGLDAREVPAGATAIVEVPLEANSSAKPITLSGTLTTELDAIVRSFEVSAQVRPQ